MKLREWQQDCLDAFVTFRNHNRDLFVFEACPGAGKSLMAAELSWQMLNEDDDEKRIDLVLVVVPWKSIQGVTPGSDQYSGMIETFDNRGLVTRERLMLRAARIVQQPVPTNLDCIITTYAEAMNQEAVDTLKLWVGKGLRIALILDEIHHANEINGSWGEYASEIQELSEMTVVMSGTFFRTDGKKIKFVEYGEDDRPILHCPAYTYTKAVWDHVCRPVSCRFTDVELRCLDEDDGLLTHNLYELDANHKRLGHVMREVFHPEGDCVRSLILDVDEHLELTRRRFHDAGALFTCRPGREASSEDKHVHQIAQKIRQYTGKDVVVVTHKDTNANGKIRAFRNGSMPYLVAVNMISEGVDIPRLRVVAFMRYITSEMMFRQIIGRIIRYTENEDGTAAMAFMPKFQLMHQFALNMERESLVGVREWRCQVCGQYPCICACPYCGQNPCVCDSPPPPPPRDKKEFEVLNATPFCAGGSVSNDEVQEAWRTIARAVMQRSPHHAHANDIQLAHAMSIGFPMMNKDAGPKEQPTHLQALSNARRRVTRLMQKLAGKVYGGDFQRCWVEEFLKPFKANWETVKNTWTVFEIEQLANKLEQRLVEAYKNGK